MSRTMTIAQRELSSMFRVPAGWVIIALFAFLTAVLFVNQTLVPGQPGSLRYFFAYAGWLLIPIAPAVSMRLMSEEYRSGSIEALRTAPAGDWAVTLGKYLGSVVFLMLMLAPTLVYPLVLMLVSEPTPDWGPVAAGYLMLLLVGMLYLGVGMLASSLTSSQTLAFLGAVMSLILLMVLTSVIAKQAGVAIGTVLGALSITARINELSKGIIDTSTIAFFLIATLWMLVLSAGVLEVRRLGRSRAFTAVTVGVFVLATGAAAGLSGYLASAYRARVDVTSTGAHELSARAKGIADRLTDPTEIVLAISHGRSDPRSVDLVSDVLDAYQRHSELINVRVIDLDAPEGLDQTRQLLRDLADRDREAIDANLEAIAAAAELMRDTAPKLTGIVSRLESIRDAIAPTTSTNANNRAVFEQRAAIFRVFARDVGAQGEKIDDQLGPYLNEQDNTGDIFPFDTYAGPIEQTLAQLMNQLDDLAAQTDAFANAAELDPEPRAIAAPMAQQLESIRDQIAVAHDRITRLTRIDALRVGRALESGEALLVIGAPEQGVAAVDLDELLPSSATLERWGVSAAGVIGPRAQQLIASALAQLVAPAQPILVFMHGGRQGELLGESELFTKTAAKLAQRGIDTLEWAAVEAPSPPDLDLLDPLGTRPVVYMVISVDTTAQTAGSGLTGARRASEMGAIVQRLIDEGQPLIVSLNPSVFPASGAPDPLAQCLTAFGVTPDSGRPLLHERIGAMGRIADPITRVVPDAGEHPLATSVSGLNTVMTWAIPLMLEPRDGVQSAPIITLPGDNQTWGESAWLTLWQRPAQARQMLTNQPTFDAVKDKRDENWVLAAAAERAFSGVTQRVVVVGSNAWASDAVTSDTEQLVDGRVTSRWPGNLTLLESSVAWLAGMDDLIGPGTEARPIATIKPLDARQRSLIRWVLLAGLPGLILLLGMAYRLIFG